MSTGESSSNEDLFKEIIIDNFRNPQNKGIVKNFDGKISASNPLCGDEISLTWRFRGDILDDIAFFGNGCAISQAAASLLLPLCENKTRAEVIEKVNSYKKMIMTSENPTGLGDLEALLGVSAYPMRIKCALLAAEGILEGLK